MSAVRSVAPGDGEGPEAEAEPPAQSGRRARQQPPGENASPPGLLAAAQAGKLFPANYCLKLRSGRTPQVRGVYYLLVAAAWARLRAGSPLRVGEAGKPWAP